MIGEFTMGGDRAVGDCVMKGCCANLFFDDAINGVENTITNTEIDSSIAAPDITLVNEGPGGALAFTPNAGNNQASGWLFLRDLFTGDTF